MPRLFNFLGALPLIVWFSWDLWRNLPSYIASYHLLDAHSHLDALVAFQILAQAVGIAYTLFVILLLLVRDVPQAHTRGTISYVAALIGAFANVSFFMLPTATLSVPLLAFATLCIIVGLGLSLYTLIYLGRSFAILPSARALVIDGPYRFIRHPLYLFEEIAILGIMIQFQQPWSVLVMVLQVTAQFVRMQYEERALVKFFPTYAPYAAKTARLIPGVY